MAYEHLPISSSSALTRQRRSSRALPLDTYVLTSASPVGYRTHRVCPSLTLILSEAESLFILVRDVPRFENLYAKKVLGLVHDLGFTGPAKRPQRIVQEGCLPFDPTTLAAGKKVGDSRDTKWFLTLREAWSKAMFFSCVFPRGSRGHVQQSGVAMHMCWRRNVLKNYARTYRLCEILLGEFPPERTSTGVILCWLVTANAVADHNSRHVTHLKRS